MHHLVDRLERLTASGVIAMYTHFEVTELFALPAKDGRPLNVYSLIVGQDGAVTAPPASQKAYLSNRLIQLRSLKSWRFGLVRYALCLPELLHALRSYAASGVWAPSGDALDVGPLEPVTGRFAPADQAFPQPWNTILKNNFWSGSHLLELSDCDKRWVAPMLQRPETLQELTEAVRPLLPLGIARMSDRLGNVVVQLPVTALVARLARQRPSDDGVLTLAWHPEISPRPLRFTWDRTFDGMSVGCVSRSLNETDATFAVPDARGLETASLWDDVHDVLLWSFAPAAFIQQITASTNIVHPERRRFSEPSGVTRLAREVRMTHAAGSTTVGRPAGTALDAWSQKRLYRAEREALAAEREFVQYVLGPGGSTSETERALDDLRLLITKHGQGGAWLWDPYLTAEDILKTLFHCPYLHADLRALTDAMQVPKAVDRPGRWLGLVRAFGFRSPAPVPSFQEVQRSTLDAHGGNLEGLRLEYRARVGHGGWGFHDRFLIFPETASGPLAWSLGTSVNALGHKHHILQRVGDGRLVADAFLDLWNRLDQPDQLVWKAP